MSTVKSISERLNSSIKMSGTASLVLSGGSSPIKIFEELSSIDLPWSEVQVTLVDDRLVEADNKDSNQNLILNYFLKSKAKAAQFFPLTEDLITKSNFLSLYTVITTGTGFPIKLFVFSLNALQNSIMLIPLWPRAGPTGGAGFACPPLICNLTYPVISFAIINIFLPDYTLNQLELVFQILIRIL